MLLALVPAIIMPSDKTEKKRKRVSERHERPSKKAVLELQALPPLAASIVEDQSELAPVIGMDTRITCNIELVTDY